MRSCGGGSGGWVLRLPQHCFDPHAFVAVVGQEFALNESRLTGFCGLTLGMWCCMGFNVVGGIGCVCDRGLRTIDVLQELVPRESGITPHRFYFLWGAHRFVIQVSGAAGRDFCSQPRVP